MQILYIAGSVAAVLGILFRSLWILIPAGVLWALALIIIVKKLVCPYCGEPCGGRMFGAAARYCSFCGKKLYDFEASQENIPDFTPPEDTGWKFEGKK